MSGSTLLCYHSNQTLEQNMPLEIETIEAIIKQHWKMPSDIKPGELRDYALEIRSFLEANDSNQLGLHQQLSRIQSNWLQQPYCASVCDAMAVHLIKLATAKKRPRDPAQLAKFVVDVATGEIEEAPADLPESAAARGRLGGKKGGPARARVLTPEQKREIAKIAAQARWKVKED
jgi:hypothetical protein